MPSRDQTIDPYRPRFISLKFLGSLLAFFSGCVCSTETRLWTPIHFCFKHLANPVSLSSLSFTSEGVFVCHLSLLINSADHEAFGNCSSQLWTRVAHDRCCSFLYV